MGKKKEPYVVVNGALHWKEGAPFTQNINEIKEPEASKIAEKLQHSSETRQLFCSYFLSGGNTSEAGMFKGKVVAFKRIRRNGQLSIMFKPIYISFLRADGKLIEGMEHHVWIQDNGAFQAMKVEQGKCYSFNANVYLYKHTGDRYEFALKDCDNVRNISAKELPKPVDLKNKMFSSMACEYCIMQEKCNRQKCSMPEWREQMSFGLANPVHVEKRPARLNMAEIQSALAEVVSEENKRYANIIKDQAPVIALPETYSDVKVKHKAKKTHVNENVSAKNWMVKVRDTEKMFDEVARISIKNHSDYQQTIAQI